MEAVDTTQGVMIQSNGREKRSDDINAVIDVRHRSITALITIIRENRRYFAMKTTSE